ncbi:MAG TPA: hypothetical protein VL171_00375 [Verrucomicrobiae bacterium]|nr:hypothetical protein [Verrucomicrobiae bacterium]
MKMKLLAWTSWIVCLISAIGEWCFDLNLPLTPAFWLLVTIAAFAVPLARGALTTNEWTSSYGDKWEAATNWASGTPSFNNAVVGITNGFAPLVLTKSITIDGTTASIAPGSMTISNLILSAPKVTLPPSQRQGRNELLIQNAASISFEILNTLTLSNGGVISVSNSNVRVDGASGFVVLYNDGSINLDTGTLIWSNKIAELGVNGQGTLTISNGMVLSGASEIGENPGASGTINMAGGTNVSDGYMFVGYAGGSTGAVWQTGGRTVVTNALTRIGNDGIGQFTLSNGTWLARDVIVGFTAGAQGTLTVAGGTAAMVGPFNIAGGPSSSGYGTGTVLVTGGEFVITNAPAAVGPGSGDFILDGSLVLTNGGTLLATNSFTFVGYHGSGILSNQGGVATFRDFDVGSLPGSRGTLSVNAGTTALSGPLTVGGAGSTGIVQITGGQLVVTNDPTSVGSGSGLIIDGSATVSNGSSITVSSVTTIVGNAGSGSLTVFGGSMFVGNLSVGNLAGSSGTIWITGGLLSISPAFISYLGIDGSGQIILSNGTLRAGDLTVGLGGAGTVTVAGGSLEGPAALTLGDGFAVTGTLWVTGGTVALTNESFNNEIGESGGQGFMTVSNGLVWARQLDIGTSGEGTLTMAGGTNTVYSSVILGASSCGASGTVVVSGGRLDVTNDAGNAMLEVRSGSLILNSGTLNVDELIITNACSHFIRSGGTLIYGTVLLDPNGDVDGDGIPNGYEQSHGLDPFNPTDASQDNDGDGQSNLQEYLAGTDPNDSASAFRITSISRTNDDLLVTWMTGVGKTNALQATTIGSYATNGFADIFVVTNTTGTVTNYTDLGGATNQPARFYRVRLVP